jgi:hypothetical protein
VVSRPEPLEPVDELATPTSLDVVELAVEMVPANEPEASDGDALDDDSADDTAESVITSATGGNPVRRRRRRGKA